MITSNSPPCDPMLGPVVGAVNYAAYSFKLCHRIRRAILESDPRWSQPARKIGRSWNNNNGERMAAVLTSQIPLQVTGDRLLRLAARHLRKHLHP
jgi:hypothetical protein